MAREPTGYESAARRVTELEGILREARDYVNGIRVEVITSHTNPRTGQPEPADVTEPEDTLLARIDAALAGSTANGVPADHHWHCITCDTRAPTPLTDETTCKCSDIYDQQWVREDGPMPAGVREDGNG